MRPRPSLTTFTSIRRAISTSLRPGFDPVQHEVDQRIDPLPACTVNLEGAFAKTAFETCIAHEFH